jgi:hypothetical protein
MFILKTVHATNAPTFKPGPVVITTRGSGLVRERKNEY